MWEPKARRQPVVFPVSACQIRCSKLLVRWSQLSSMLRKGPSEVLVSSCPSRRLKTDGAERLQDEHWLGSWAAAPLLRASVAPGSWMSGPGPATLCPACMCPVFWTCVADIPGAEARRDQNIVPG